MRAFEVSVNGKRVCVAGVGDHGVLTAMVDYVLRPDGQEMSFEVGGLITPLEEHVRWVRQDLGIGDEISVKLIESESVDAPIIRHRDDPEKKVEAQKRYAREMAKKFGWKIQARRKPK